MPAGDAFPEPFDLSIGAAFAIDVLPAHGPAVPFGAPGADHRSIGADRKWPFKLVLHCRLSSSCTAARPARRAAIQNVNQGCWFPDLMVPESGR
jgi:hypothetical protein